MARSSSGKHKRLSWEYESSGINNVRRALRDNAKDIYSEYQEFLWVGKEKFDDERLHTLKNKIYLLTKEDLIRWGLRTAMDPRSAPYFKGSYIIALIKTLEELELNLYGFANKYETEKDGIRSVQAAIEKFEPDLWKGYTQYEQHPASFSKRSLRELKDKFYKLTSVDFEDWGITESYQADNAPYFEGSYITALQKSFKALNLNPYAFMYRFNNEEAGIKSVRAALERFEPDLWEDYQEYAENPVKFSLMDLQELRERFYQLERSDFRNWNLSGAINPKIAPYFKRNYTLALQKSFKELDLNPYAFHYRFVTEEDGIKSIQAALERFSLEFWEEYKKYEQNPSGFTAGQLYTLKDRAYKIKYAHFSKWLLSATLHKRSAPYFQGSYKVALKKSLPALNLEINEIGQKHFTLRFQWKDGIEKGIANIHEATRLERPDIWNEYQAYLKDKDRFGKERLRKLKNKIYEITQNDFQIWGIPVAYNKVSAPYFEGSYALALQKSFKELDLNIYAFYSHRSTEEELIKSVQAAIERFKPELWEGYQAYLRDQSAFDATRLKELKDDIYGITSAHLAKWNLTPGINGSYIETLQKSLPGIALNPYAFRYRFVTEEDGIKSVRAALERFEPELWNEYRQYLEIREQATETQLKNLKNKFDKLRRKHFSAWSLHAALKQDISPYFNRSYKLALQKSFPEVYEENSSGEAEDAAMLASEDGKNVGGIDMNLKNTRIQEYGTDMTFTSNYELIQPFMGDGFYPVIIHISPISTSTPF